MFGYAEFNIADILMLSVFSNALTEGIGKLWMRSARPFVSLLQVAKGAF